MNVELAKYKVWCSVNELYPLKIGEPAWSGEAATVQEAGIEAAKAFTREDPGLSPIRCRIECEGLDKVFLLTIIARKTTVWEAEES